MTILLIFAFVHVHVTNDYYNVIIVYYFFYVYVEPMSHAPKSPNDSGCGLDSDKKRMKALREQLKKVTVTPNRVVQRGRSVEELTYMYTIHLQTFIHYTDKTMIEKALHIHTMTQCTVFP